MKKYIIMLTIMIVISLIIVLPVLYPKIPSIERIGKKVIMTIDLAINKEQRVENTNTIDDINQGEIIDLRDEEDLLAQENEEKLKFTDVDEKSWTYDAIVYMNRKNILQGFPDGKFKPNDSITKEALAKILATAFELNTVEIPKDQINEIDSIYEDVKVSRWSYKYIDATKQLLWGEYKNKKLYFNPTQNMTKEEVICALVLMLGLSNNNVDLTVLDKYPDREEINYDIQGLIAIALENDLLNKNNEKLELKKEITRAEVSYLIWNALVKNKKLKERKLKELTEDELVNIQLDSIKYTIDLDKELGTKKKIFNDGFVSFYYPIEYTGAVSTKDITYYGMSNYLLMTKDYFITLYYSTDPENNKSISERGIGTNALPELFKYLSKGIYKQYKKENINNDYILLNYSSEYGNKNYIWGRGIDKYIPQLIILPKNKTNNAGEILAKSEDEIFNEEKELIKVTDIVREKFKVVTNIKPFKSPGNDKSVMETIPKNHEDNVSSTIECQIKVNANIGWGAKYNLYTEDLEEIKDIDMYYCTNANVLKIRFGQMLEEGKTYILKPEILNDIDGNFIEGGEIIFTVGMQEQIRYSYENYYSYDD